MRTTFSFQSVSSAKLLVSLVLTAFCGTALLVNPEARNVDRIQSAWEQVWPFHFGVSASVENEMTSKEPLPSISAGTKYYAVSLTAQGKDDFEFDKKVTLLIETSQARIDLFVATLESNPSRAKTCANTVEGPICAKLNSVMMDAVTSLDQADLAIESYQKKGIVADPVLARMQKQAAALKLVSLQYPGIGPAVER